MMLEPIKPVIPALTLWQPWASLVAMGVKTVETRSWATSYRGPLLIHAAKTVNGRTIEAIRRIADFLQDENLSLLPAPMPLGKVVAVVDLLDCVRANSGIKGQFPPLEYELGDLASGRFAWKLANVRALADPVEASGSQRLWTPTRSVLERVMNQLEIS